MVKKPIKKRIRRILLSLLISVLSLVIIINVPIITIGTKTSDVDYSSWMFETLINEQKVVDIAMLGAHDAFSNEINLFSRIDESADSIMKGFTGALIKGFIVKQSKTQMDDVDDLLIAGVRYFDIRLTYDEGNWYTKHNYISGDFWPIAEKLTDFMQANPGEFLVLDFQHINGLDYSYQSDYDTFVDMLSRTGLLEKTKQVDNLSSITYGEITDNKSSSKAIIISKFEDSSGKVLYYDDSIRSNWANSDNFEYITSFMETESESIRTESNYGNFRIMQAVATMQMSVSGIVNGILTWSLIDRAKRFNEYLLNYDNIDALMEDMPIVMVDYANTNFKGFNDQIMQKIMDFNENS